VPFLAKLHFCIDFICVHLIYICGKNSPLRPLPNSGGGYNSDAAICADERRSIMSPTDIRPPFTEETARQKVKAAENAWNTRDPERVALAYTPDSDWRNRAEFIKGREQIKAFLRRKWDKELDYRLRKELWCWTENRIAVTFKYEWHDDSGQWYRSYGNELWEFENDGLMRRRIASINDMPIAASDRQIVAD
jgi:nuclear transport factor 2 (NTF2) superfamily protein